MSKIYLQIPKPCHEDWNKMTPVEKGRFCDSCQKTVRDFTSASDREIASLYNEKSEVCGRFLSNQLHRELIVPTEKSSVWSLAASGVLGMLSLASAQAQEKPRPQAVLMVGDNFAEVEVAETVSAERDSVLEQGASKIITGIVSDASGPLPGANVMIAETKFGVQTDLDGKYQIEVKQGQRLIFSYVGYADSEIKVGAATNLDVKMKEGNERLDETKVIYAGYVSFNSFKRPSFAKRTYNHIRNWFR